MDNPLDTTDKPDTTWRESLSGLREKGFFKYIGRSILMILLVYLLVVLIVFLTGKYLIDFNAFFSGIIERLSDRFWVVYLTSS